ncbi:putative Ig domain-containing protein [Larkinella insperata]|uniref:Ig domain-containing protein n=1 Tax=Larkinella insperata TaxID=332158 RepID=A0ABW3QBL4_9BACT|nr:putative Ig domain-containing protein [Larkinella insperata]
MIRTLLSTLFCLFFLLLIAPQSVALAGAKPSVTYSVAPKIPGGQRYLAIVIFNYETDPRIDDERIENAARMGCNAAEISVHWDQVYPTRNSAPNWRVVDSHVNTALRMGMKVAIRIQLARAPNLLDGFWSAEESMKGADNARMNFAGGVQFSFAHQPTLDLAKDFVRQATQHYQYLQQQDQLLFFSATVSPIQEAEYSPRNEGPNGSYPIPFDYGEPMKQGFRQWLQGRFSLEDLNKRWGSDFSRWEAVNPPSYNQADPYISFNRGRWGEDWYVFRHLMLKRFLDETNRTIKEVNGAIQVINQHGSVWDRQSGLRGSFAFRNLAQNADGVKINDGPDYNHRFSMDIVRSNVRPGGWVCNEVDGLFHTTVSVQRFYEQVEESFEHGAQLVTLANFGGWDAREKLNQVIQRVVSRGLLSQPATQVQPASNTSYKLSAMVRDDVGKSEHRASDQWSRQYVQNGRRPVNIVIDEDWLEDNANQDPRVSRPIPNQTAYVERPFEYSIPSGTFEDPDGSITKVEITSGLPALGLSANGVTISGTPNATGTITVAVQAVDNKNTPVTTQFQIKVLGQNANEAPVVAKPIDDRTANVGLDYAFTIPDGTFKDPDGRIASIEVADLPGGLSYNADKRLISGKPTNEGVSTITLKATDDKGTSVSTSFKLTVTKQEDVNRPPVVSKTIPAQTATIGKNFSYTLAKETFSDPDGEIRSIEVDGLPDGFVYESEIRKISGTPTQAATVTVKVKATDNKGASVTTEFRLTIKNAGSSDQLVLLEPTMDCNTGEIKFRTSGGDGSKIEFRAVGIVEDWTTETTFTVAPWLRNGTTFEIQARQDGKEVKYSYTSPCKGYEPPVVANPMSDQSYRVGEFFILRIPAETFRASTPYQITVSALPEGIWYDKETRAISGTAAKTGETTVTLTATDERGAKVEDGFVLTIRENTSKPLAMLSPTFSCQTGKLTIRTEGGNGSTITYSIQGVADWTSNPAFTIDLDKRNGAELRLLARQGDREVSYVYKTSCSPSSTLDDQTIVVGQSYSYSLLNPGAGITYKVSGLPAGLSYNSDNRTISGIPTETGTTTLSIKAVDDKGNEMGELSFRLIVVANSTNPVAGSYEGFLDVVNCSSIAGWVWNRDAPNTPVSIEFLVGSSLSSARVVGRIEANLFRQDLKDSDKGNGSHGYRWDTPQELKNNQTYSIWGRVAGTDYLLKGSPKTLSCNGDTPSTPGKPTDPVPANQPPVAPTVSTLSTTVNTAYQVTLPAFTDPENGTLAYTMSGLPKGADFDRVSRVLTATVATTGSYKLTYTATDNQGVKTSVEINFIVSVENAPNEPTTPTNPVAGSYEGFLDVVNCSSIAGWVWNRDAPNTPVSIEFLVGSSLSSARVVGRIEANLFRQDLKDSDKGNGSHGYRWDTPQELKNNQTYSIWGRVAGTDYLLKGSPKTLSCNGDAPLTPGRPTDPVQTNQPPVVPNVIELTVTVNKAFETVLPAFTDPEKETLAYSVSGLPKGTDFDRVSRVFTGTIATTGSYKLTYTATDKQGAKTSVEVRLTVTDGTTPATPTEPNAPTNPLTGNYEGFLDVVNCSSIAGWVWNRDAPNTPVSIEFLVGSSLSSARVVGRIEASLFRQDLKDSDKGNGSHGYRWDTPQELKNNQTYSIWGRVAGTDYLLKGSPKTLSCNGDTPTTPPTTPETPPTPAEPTPPTDSALAVLAPDYNCQTGKITFRTKGGDKTRIEYRVTGVTDWTTGATQTLDLTMREGSTLVLEARQSQKVVTYSYTTVCADGYAPIKDQVIVKGVSYSTTLEEVGAGSQLDVTGLPEGIGFTAADRKVSGKPQKAGEYTVTVKSTKDQKSHSIRFKLTVREPELTVQLMKAGNESSRQVIQTLNDNDAVGVRNLPNAVDLFTTANVPVGSIAFELTGTSSKNNVDNDGPYGLFGDDNGMKPEAGKYVLRLAAFTGPNGTGELITTKNVTFSFVSGGGRMAGNAEAAGEAWQVYPNPVREVINLTLPVSLPAQSEAMPYQFSLTSTAGGQWELQGNTVENNRRQVALDVKTLQLPTGLYFLRIQNEEGVLKVIKVLKQ